MRNRWLRLAVAVAVLAAVVLVVWANRKDVPAAAHALRTANGYWLSAGLGLLALWWLDWTLLHASARRMVGTGGYAELGGLVPVTLMSIALNLAIKSGNVAGLAAFTVDARRRGSPTGRVTAAYLAAAQLAEVAFVVTLAAGLVVVWADGRLTRPEVVAVVIFLAGLVVRIAALVAAVRSREVVRRLWTLPARTFDRLLGRPPRPHSTSGADELYDAVAAIRARPRASVPALCFAVAVDVLGAALLWASMAAVGAGSEPLVALVAYAVSTLFGIVGVMPGGIGFVEFGAVAVLVSYGTPIGIAAAAVVVFRVLVFWIPLVAGGLIGWWFRRAG
ncbi:lysylphosphatidylglycerol synthase transmembrane domain-containing protein [Saccharopolyspora taberi]|uniref:Flippase-like domain-containing protein n=1 Tax=Saccharopolyspora taberi TaxID=60895 RepID=A0ABN3VC70_9PSEU